MNAAAKVAALTGQHPTTAAPAPGSAEGERSDRSESNTRSLDKTRSACYDGNSAGAHGPGRRERRPEMAGITTKDGVCQEGCGAETAKGRRFKQGHDARLKSVLYKAIRAGEQVKVDGKNTDPAQVVTSFGWPQPAAKAPRKSRARKSTAKKSTAKKSTAKRTSKKAA